MIPRPEVRDAIATSMRLLTMFEHALRLEHTDPVEFRLTGREIERELDDCPDVKDIIGVLAGVLVKVLDVYTNDTPGALRIIALEFAAQADA